MIMVKIKYLNILKSAFKKRKSILDYIKDFCIEIISYGFLLNIITFVFLGTGINIVLIIGLGVLKYFVTDEFPLFIDKLRGAKS